MRSVAEVVAIAFGAVYLLVGLAGFAVTSGVGFADQEGNAARAVNTTSARRTCWSASSACS